MKKTITLIVLLISFCNYAQNIESLKINAQKIYDYTAKQDFNGILDLSYPKLFTIAPRETMLKVLESSFNGNSDFKIKLITVDPNFQFGEIKKIENKTFCIIKHNNAMTMTFTEKIETPDMYINLFKESMKASEVTFDEKTNSINIKLISTMIAVADDTTNNEWRFLNDDKSGKIFTLIFNDNIKKELGL